MGGTSRAMIAKQPILGRDRELVGYELLFRSNSKINMARVKDDRLATSKVLSEVLNTFGLSRLVGEAKAFINVDGSFLMDDVVGRIPPERFVLEVLETVPVDAHLGERLAQLKAQGYTIALDDFDFSPVQMENFFPLMPHISIVKIDLMAIKDKSVLKEKLALFKDYNVQFLAEKVETLEEFELCKSLGFSYFQGYFFAKPVIIEGKKLDPNRMGVLKLTQMLQSDKEIEAIIREFDTHPDLMINLLKYINTSGFSLKNEVKSIAQAINMLGRLPLAQWLTLFMYGDCLRDRRDMSILIDAILLRAELMTLLCKRYKLGKEVCEKAHLCGVLSMIDTVFGVPLSEVFEGIRFDPEIEGALLRKEGLFSKLLVIVKVVEQGDFTKIQKLTEKIKMPVAELYAILSTAYENVSRMEKA